MHHLKDLARRMDCHPRTVKRWWRKLNAELLAAGKPGVYPDVPGHGPHRWHDATADRIIQLWADYYKTHGTTAQIVRAKFAGKFNDLEQFDLLSFKPKTIFNGFPQIAPKRRIHTKGMGKAHPQAKKRSTKAERKTAAAAGKGGKGRVAAAQ